MRWILTVTLALGWPAAGLAQQSGSPSPYAPVPTPTIDPYLSIPQQTAPQETSKFKVDNDAKAPGWTLPNRIDLGKSQLQFDAKHTSEVNTLGMATDSGETSNLSKAMPLQKQESTLPNYFGLKFSTPMH